MNIESAKGGNGGMMKFRRRQPSAFDFQPSIFVIRSWLHQPNGLGSVAVSPEMSNIERRRMNDEGSESGSFSLRHSSFDIRYSQLAAPAQRPWKRRSNRE
jgi:hypothetical protein